MQACFSRGLKVDFVDPEIVDGVNVDVDSELIQKYYFETLQVLFNSLKENIKYIKIMNQEIMGTFIGGTNIFVGIPSELIAISSNPKAFNSLIQNLKNYDSEFEEVYIGEDGIIILS